MLLPAVGHHLEEARPFAGPDAGHGLPRLGDQAEQVVAVEQLRRHPVGASAAANVGPALAAALVRVDGVLVVLADKQDG